MHRGVNVCAVAFKREPNGDDRRVRETDCVDPLVLAAS